MNLPAQMSWRYLVARKSTNAVNIITWIAAFGVAVGAAALILVLSVFNGFEDIFLDNFNNLNPDVRIAPASGKTFTVTDDLLASIDAVPGVDIISQTIEETAIFSYADKQSPGRIRGVDARYAGINGIDTMILDGKYTLHDTSSRSTTALIGNDLSLALSIDPLNQFEELTVFMSRPKPRGGGNPLLSGRSSYLRRDFQPSGIVRSQDQVENTGVFVEIDQARRLLSVGDSTVSALEVRLTPDRVSEDTYAAIAAAVGPDFVVSNRYQQENSVLKLMQIEKWIGFAIVCLMMVLISFNLIGALYMIVLEKRRDIAILRSLGMTGQDVRGLFLRVGLSLTALGLLGGYVLATLLYAIQKTYGLVPLPGTMNEAYPLEFRAFDFVYVAITVLVVGALASYLPAWRAGKVEAYIND